MISLKNIIILILTFIFIYLIFEYFYNNISPKIIESFDFSENISNSINTFSLKDIPSQFDINLTKVGGLQNIETQIKAIADKQKENQKTIDTLNIQITGNK